MKRILLLVTVAGRRLAADGVTFIDSRYTRRLLVLSATLTACMVAVLMGYATLARADVACDSRQAFCLEKTATPETVTVGEPLTFTIKGYCGPGAPGCFANSADLGGLSDPLPEGLEFVSASATSAFNNNPTCTFTESDRTVFCTPISYTGGMPDVPYVATIEVIPRECGTFTNIASFIFFGRVVGAPAPETYTVEGCPDTTDPTLSVSHAGANADNWNNTSPVTLNVSASDSDSGLAGDPTCTDGTTALTLTAGTWTTSVSGDGTHTISCSVTDKAGNQTTASDTVMIDTTAPSVSCIASPSKLSTSANNHKLVSIKATVTVTDNTGGSGANGFTLVSVTSNQPQSGLASDDVPNDIQDWSIGTADTSGQIRAERYGTGRVYTLTYKGKDLAGNTKNCQATVTVPKGG